jgi:histidine triad (HIT) family protein
MANSSITKLLFMSNFVWQSSKSLLRTRYGPCLLSWILTKMSFLIPADKLIETNTLLAFHHPNPGYPVHILLVPKKQKIDIFDLRVEDQNFMVDLFVCVQHLVRRFSLDRAGYRLIVNGGAYQEFPYLHFHLVSGG